jgi:hypothetical protein
VVYRFVYEFSDRVWLSSDLSVDFSVDVKYASKGLLGHRRHRTSRDDDFACRWAWITDYYGRPFLLRVIYL